MKPRELYSHIPELLWDQIEMPNSDRSIGHIKDAKLFFATGMMFGLLHHLDTFGQEYLLTVGSYAGGANLAATTDTAFLETLDYFFEHQQEKIAC